MVSTQYMLVVINGCYYLKHEAWLWCHLLQEALPDCTRFIQVVLWASSEPSVTSFRAHLAQDRDFERKDIL